MVYPRTSNRQCVSRSMELTKVTRKQLVNLSIIVPPHSHIYIYILTSNTKKKKKRKNIFHRSKITYAFTRMVKRNHHFDHLSQRWRTCFFAYAWQYVTLDCSMSRNVSRTRNARAVQTVESFSPHAGIYR